MRVFGVLYLCLCVLIPGALFGQGQTYIEGYLGPASIDGIGVNTDETSFGLWGGYAFSENIAVEIGYGNYGESKVNFSDTFDGTPVEVHLSTTTAAFNIGIKGVVPLDGGFFLTGKVGMAFWGIDVTETNIADNDGSNLGSAKATLDNRDMYFGFGANYMISETAYVTLNHLMMEFDDIDIDVGVSTIGIGILF